MLEDGLRDMLLFLADRYGMTSFTLRNEKEYGGGGGKLNCNCFVESLKLGSVKMVITWGFTLDRSER